MADEVDLGVADLQHPTVIGSGGFATVYRAWDEPFSRWVAVKVLHSLDEAGRRRFDRERGILGQLSGHPAVVTPHRYGLTAKGAPYLVMEYLEGGSLEDNLNHRRRLAWADVAECGVVVGDALAYAHARGILHRDVKPANILVTGTVGGMAVKLADFGIAGLREATSTQLAFTLAHCPPETFAGGRDQRDERSDLYSLASTLYTLISGRAPYAVEGADSQPAYLIRITDHPLPDLDPAFVPPPVAAVIHRALAKDPAARPATALEFTAALRHASGAIPTGVTIPTTPPPSTPIGNGVGAGGPEKVGGPTGRTGPRPARLAVGLLAAGVAGAGTVAWWWAGRPETVSGACQQATVDEIECHGHTGQVESVTGLSDGRFASVSRDGTVRVWNLAALDDPAVGFSAGVRLNAVAGLPDGDLLFGGADQRTWRWDPSGSDEPTAMMEHDSDVQEIAVLDRDEVAIGAGQLVVATTEGLEIDSLDTTDQGGLIALAPLDGDRIAYSGNNDQGNVVIWDRTTGTTSAVRPRPTKGTANQAVALAGLGDGRFVSSHRFTPADTDAPLWVWQSSPQDRLEFTGHRAEVEAIDVTADGRVVSAGGDDGRVLVWDPDNIDAPPVTLATESTAVTAIAVLPDHRIAVGLVDGRIIVHSPPSG